MAIAVALRLTKLHKNSESKQSAPSSCQLQYVLRRAPPRLMTKHCAQCATIFIHAGACIISAICQCAAKRFCEAHKLDTLQLSLPAVAAACRSSIGRQPNEAKGLYIDQTA
eukprot:1377-Heterococcus_DN1.PRE.2